MDRLSRVAPARFWEVVFSWCSCHEVWRASRLELLIAFRPDRLGMTGEHIGRRNEADRAV